MKQMKYFGILMMLVFAGFGFVACSSDDDNDDNSDGGGNPSLVGTWLDVQSRYTCAWRFEKNGTCQYTEWDKNEPEYWDPTDHVGKWKVSENNLNVRWTYSDDEYNFTFTISDDGKTLTLYEGDYGKRGTYTKR